MTSRNLRRVLAGAGVFLGSAALLVACGGSDDDSGPQSVTVQQACDALTGKTIATGALSVR